MENFQIAAGSITGSDHKKPLLTVNCQDSFYYDECENKIVAVVCDGCGGSPHSEVGAKIGARIIANTFMQFRFPEVAPTWEQGWMRINQHLAQVAGGLMGFNCSWEQAVEEFLLFTIVGVIITPQETLVFTRGDGSFQVNDEITCLSQNNRPDYLGYYLIKASKYEPTPILNVRLPTSEINKLVLSTDGAEQLLGEEITEIMNDELTWQNPDYLRRQLTLRQKAKPKDFFDDATLITIRRTP